MARNRRRNRFKFTEKKHSTKGIITLGVALILLILFIIFIAKAFQSEGQLSMYFGSAGVFAMIASLIAFVFSIQSIREENSFQFFPRMAFGFSFINLICWIGTYVFGFILTY